MPDKKIKIDKSSDCIGLYCPEPIFRLREALDKMQIGEILELIADDPASEEDVKRFCKRTENELLSIEKEGNTFKFLIRKLK